MKRTFSFLLCAGALMAADTVRIPEIYRDPSQKPIDAALTDQDGMRRLQYLCDRMGNRVSGSASLERMTVKVPKWIRGRESATMPEPVNKPLTMLGLGMSVGTSAEGITGDVDAVTNFDQLKGMHYFDWHHTDADSFDKIVPREFQRSVAALAVVSCVVADMPERFTGIK